ncbi:Hypothetical predicted protein [Pelobates cultripes]|uniref:exodeoxyribonuclease III n=1 Tax=Pelobates cultripes TaxID=61616 RepID=A0AAD1RLF0_PELCU|nr:Hypothetical predicted protein [Pelobates cultripes]
MAYRLDSIKIITQNCRGLNLAERRTHLLRELQRDRAAIALLQETHFQKGLAPPLRNKHYPTNYFSNHPAAKKAGVAIMIATRVQFRELDKEIDERGRYAFIKGEISDRRYTIATIYAPNRNQARRLTRLQKASITAATWSDYGQVSIDIDSLFTRPIKKTWRLNDTLLTDLRDQITQALTTYFSENETDDVSDMTVWEAHKSVI